MIKGRHFDQTAILLCVHWNLAYNLSLRIWCDVTVCTSVSCATLQFNRQRHPQLEHDFVP